MIVLPLPRRWRCAALGVLLGPVALSLNSHALQAQTPMSTSRTNTLDFANAKLADVIRTLATMLGRTVLMSEIGRAHV